MSISSLISGERSRSRGRSKISRSLIPLQKNEQENKLLALTVKVIWNSEWRDNDLRKKSYPTCTRRKSGEVDEQPCLQDPSSPWRRVHSLIVGAWCKCLLDIRAIESVRLSLRFTIPMIGSHSHDPPGREFLSQSHCSRSILDLNSIPE